MANPWNPSTQKLVSYRNEADPNWNLLTNMQPGSWGTNLVVKDLKIEAVDRDAIHGSAQGNGLVAESFTYENIDARVWITRRGMDRKVHADILQFFGVPASSLAKPDMTFRGCHFHDGLKVDAPQPATGLPILSGGVPNEGVGLYLHSHWDVVKFQWVTVERVGRKIVVDGAREIVLEDSSGVRIQCNSPAKIYIRRCTSCSVDGPVTVVESTGTPPVVLPVTPPVTPPPVVPPVQNPAGLDEGLKRNLRAVYDAIGVMLKAGQI